jgi:hypothetical protein
MVSTFSVRDKGEPAEPDFSQTGEHLCGRRGGMNLFHERTPSTDYAIKQADSANQTGLCPKKNVYDTNATGSGEISRRQFKLAPIAVVSLRVWVARAGEWDSKWPSWRIAWLWIIWRKEHCRLKRHIDIVD